MHAAVKGENPSFPTAAINSVDAPDFHIISPRLFSICDGSAHRSNSNLKMRRFSLETGMHLGRDAQDASNAV
jgi:hypothetical protein